MNQVARNLNDAEEGFLVGKRYLIHDRDPLFTAEFLETLGTSGVKSVKLPPRSPNLNAHAERFVRTIKESCLERMILFGEGSLRRRFTNSLCIITANVTTKGWATGSSLKKSLAAAAWERFSAASGWVEC